MELRRQVYGSGVQLLIFGEHQLKAAQHGRRHVVRVPLYGRGHLQQVICGESVSAHCIGRHQTTSNGGGTAAQAALQGYLVLAAQPQLRHLPFRLLKQESHRPVHQIIPAGA